ncbi:MAG: AAA family ATPase [Bacteroidaceae bacterium]|nr:AAA family ATPase [Bacteroidaceae bacterium]
MEQKDIKNISLTKSQEKTLKQILDFIDHPTDRVFILKGYAGTGKTTLMRFLIRELKKKEKSYKLLASTGRAAKVLANLSGNKTETSTIHAMVYCFNGLNKEFDEQEEIKMDKNGQLYLLFEPAQIKPDSTPETVYIVDEASMVSDMATKDVIQAKFGEGRLLKELLDYDKRLGSKFVFVGDPCQLPPIEEYYSPALMPEYFQSTFGIKTQEAQLTEIIRQKDSQGIIDASKQVRGLYSQAPASKDFYGNGRLWGYLPFRGKKNIQLHSGLEEMIEDYVRNIKLQGLNNAVCICRSNKMCSVLSENIRKRLGFTGSRIQEGDLLMVVQNNLPTGLMNGDMVVVKSISPETLCRADLTFRPIEVKELFTGKVYNTLAIEDVIYQSQLNLSNVQQQELFIDFIIRMRKLDITQKKKANEFYLAMQNDPYLNALRCMYGYAITCHKSQGGEWDNVYVHMPRNITLNPTKETYQWIYTAMTRAAKTMHITDDFYIK